MHIAKQKYAVLLLIQNAAPFLKIKQFTLLKYSNRNWIYILFLTRCPSETSYGEKSLLKLRGWIRKLNATSQSIINESLPNLQQLLIM